MNKLKNKVTVITGGNSGIGFGIAAAFKSDGATGAIVGRNAETLADAAAQLGDDFIAINADVTHTATLQDVFIETAEKFGKIDVLVANAGAGTTGTVESTTEAEYNQTMDLNLKSVYFTVQKALPYMNDGGSIILIGSNAAHRAYPSFGLYGAAKAAVIYLARALSNDLLDKNIRVNVITPGTTPSFGLYGAAKAAVIYLARALSNDLLDKNIRVNVITPGTTETPAFEKFVPAEQIEAIKKHFASVMPTGRIGQPSDIGKTAVFLASDDSSFLLGSEILVDGGMTYLSR
ncbi:SDR family NAD(P)-dependent oxidoreductase [Pedobacter sp. BMA]|uniref:SDR family NAD(P)-dependent oxidoreductase n=1 Tax=Pedobacter sp. BMA TaxID=1663685 RepID=UPI0006493631|nr:SDR family oxidoreductase [Pedobacter sp. BMA]KLT64716.1 short-chain dehydrogenase [Pedobacter sp. BMA]